MESDAGFDSLAASEINTYIVLDRERIAPPIAPAEPALMNGVNVIIRIDAVNASNALMPPIRAVHCCRQCEQHIDVVNASSALVPT